MQHGDVRNILALISVFTAALVQHTRCESQVFWAKVYGNITHSPSDSLCVVHSLSSLRFFPTICRLSDDGNVILMIIDIEMRRSGVGNATWNVEKIAARLKRSDVT